MNKSIKLRPPMSLPEIQWELLAMNISQLRKLAESVKFPRHTRLKGDALRREVINTVTTGHEKFNDKILNLIHEELR